MLQLDRFLLSVGSIFYPSLAPLWDLQCLCLAAPEFSIWHVRCRWVIPFSRQFLASAIGMTPIVPWVHKMALVKHWLIRCYYRPCHMEHLIPEGGPKDMNYTGRGPT